MERVEASVREIRSMVQILPPLLHDEVIIPKSNAILIDDDSDLKKKMEADEERMRRRLEVNNIYLNLTWSSYV